MKKLFILFFNFVFVGIYAQQDSTSSSVKYRKTMPVFLEISTGFNKSKFIDFATSPLYYKGFLRNIMVGIRKETSKREVFFASRYTFGKYKMNFNDITTVSNSLANISLRYTRLYQLDVFNDERWNLKVGGTFDIAGDLRTNPALMNNQLGYEAFTTLFASGKISRDISNNEKVKFLFLKFKPKTRRLSYQLDVAVVNGVWRNDYIYSNSTPVYNEPSIFAQHPYKLFSGYRMSSRLDYEVGIFNNNTLKFSYIWDAMMSGKKDQDRFQMVNNVWMVSLNFKLR
jgi:hypothetical protein